MNPNLQVRTLQGILRCGEHQSTCAVMQRIAGEGQATYYTNAQIVDSSVTPHLDDGKYEFSYLGETNASEVVTREDEIWLKVPPSTRRPPQS
jgi:hypothetical protein